MKFYLASLLLAFVSTTTTALEVASNVTDIEADNQGRELQRRCANSGQCAGNEYCRGGVCMRKGTCVIDADCYNPTNNPRRFLFKSAFVCKDRSGRTGRCRAMAKNQHCTDSAPVIGCQQSPCEALPCGGSAMCRDVFCGGCFALHFDASGNPLCASRSFRIPGL